jgi:hypothetical protein
MDQLMGKIVNVREVQKELDRAARDARVGSADVRAGRFVHGNGGGGHLPPERARPNKPASDKNKRAR